MLFEVKPVLGLLTILAKSVFVALTFDRIYESPESISADRAGSETPCQSELVSPIWNHI